MRLYKIPPLIIPHYNLQSAALHKIEALSSRTVIQARDIFDLYILTSQYKPFLPARSRPKPAGRQGEKEEIKIGRAQFRKAYENVFEVGFKQFQDTVIAYLSVEDQIVYDSSPLWDEIKLKAANFIEEIKGIYV